MNNEVNPTGPLSPGTQQPRRPHRKPPRQTNGGAAADHVRGRGPRGAQNGGAAITALIRPSVARPRPFGKLGRVTWALDHTFRSALATFSFPGRGVAPAGSTWGSDGGRSGPCRFCGGGGGGEVYVTRPTSGTQPCGWLAHRKHRSEAPSGGPAGNRPPASSRAPWWGKRR